MFVERENIFGFGICGHLSRYHTCATQLPPNFAKAKRKSCFPLRMKLFHVEFPEWTQRTSFGLLTQNCAVICKFTLFRGAVNNSPLFRCWRPIFLNAPISGKILPTNNIHFFTFLKYFPPPFCFFCIFSSNPSFVFWRGIFVVAPFLNKHFLMLAYFGSRDTQMTRLNLLLLLLFLGQANACCWAREAAAAWTDTASRLGLCEKAPVRGRGKACAMHM